MALTSEYTSIPCIPAGIWNIAMVDCNTSQKKSKTEIPPIKSPACQSVSSQMNT
jgi:hypothetical protein